MAKLILKGTPASVGKVKGKVRILMNPSECNKFIKGEILVTEMTDPRYMPAIEKASAIITEIGGLLCHAAITAREFRIPCIVNAENASTKLKTGQLIIIDATTGKVYGE